MPEPIQTAQEAAALAAAFRVQGRLPLQLDETVVPVVLLRDLTGEVGAQPGGSGPSTSEIILASILAALGSQPGLGDLERQVAGATVPAGTWLPWAGWSRANPGGGIGPDFAFVSIRPKVGDDRRILIRQVGIFAPAGTAHTAGVSTIVGMGATPAWQVGHPGAWDSAPRHTASGNFLTGPAGAGFLDWVVAEQGVVVSPGTAFGATFARVPATTVLQWIDIPIALQANENQRISVASLIPGAEINVTMHGLIEVL